MLEIVFNNLDVLGILTNITDCKSVLDEELISVLQDIYGAIQIAVPILVILLCSVDIVRAVVAQDDKDIKDAQARSLKRIVIGLAIFFIPLIIDVLLDLAGVASGSCHIGG